MFLLGVHDSQLYVQPSVKMMAAVEDSINNAVFSGDVYPIQMPRVQWMPYIATGIKRNVKTEILYKLHYVL